MLFFFCPVMIILLYTEGNTLRADGKCILIENFIFLLEVLPMLRFDLMKYLLWLQDSLCPRSALHFFLALALAFIYCTGLV